MTWFSRHRLDQAVRRPHRNGARSQPRKPHAVACRSWTGSWHSGCGSLVSLRLGSKNSIHSTSCTAGNDAALFVQVERNLLSLDKILTFRDFWRPGHDNTLFTLVINRLLPCGEFSLLHDSDMAIGNQLHDLALFSDILNG